MVIGRNKIFYSLLLLELLHLCRNTIDTFTLLKAPKTLVNNSFFIFAIFNLNTVHSWLIGLQVLNTEMSLFWILTPFRFLESIFKLYSSILLLCPYTPTCYSEMASPGGLETPEAILISSLTLPIPHLVLE